MTQKEFENMMEVYTRWSRAEDEKDPRRAQVRRAIKAVSDIDDLLQPGFHIHDLKNVALGALQAIHRRLS